MVCADPVEEKILSKKERRSPIGVWGEWGKSAALVTMPHAGFLAVEKGRAVMVDSRWEVESSRHSNGFPQAETQAVWILDG